MLGDSWSLLIVRDIVYFGKKTYGEFLRSQESIARNVLAERLRKLIEKGILVKKPHPHDGRKDIYQLSEMGLGLIPILLDMADWGATNDPNSDAPEEWLAVARARHKEVIALATNVVRDGGSLFVGPHSVAAQLENKPRQGRNIANIEASRRQS
jgi:DNA-binding HxlR family transcriptional regulator